MLNDCTQHLLMLALRKDGEKMEKLSDSEVQALLRCDRGLVTT